MDVLKRHFDVVSFVALAALFIAWPELDLITSHLFFSEATGDWIWRYEPINVAFYGIFRYLPYMLVPLLLAGLVMTWLKRGLPASQRKVWAFLLVSLLAGPGILVHSVFKEGFERPRPKQTVEFGGKSEFSPAFVISDTCKTTCRSFVSGHSAMAFWIMALAWWTRRMTWFWIGLGLGTLMSIGRMAQGGHYLSDTIFAGYLCYFVYRLTSAWLLGHSRIRPDSA